MPHRLTTIRRYKISNDVLILILGYLDPPTLWRACKAFKRIYVTVMEYLPLYYLFELAMAGMKDGPVSHSYRPPVGRLDLLKSYRKDWPKLEWTHEYKMLIPTHARAGITGGFLHQINVHGSQYTLDLAELPSCRTSRPPALTRHLRFTTPQIENIAIDRSQSLIVTSHLFSGQNGQIGVRLHLRELWTFGKHPRTSTVVYDFTAGSSRIANMSMIICGQKLIISIESASGRMKHLLLNWRNLHARWFEDQDIHCLNENYLLVVKRSRGLPVLNMYNIFDIAAVTVEREYQLPEHWSNAVIGFNQNTAPLTDNSASSEALFYPDPSNRILVITARTPPLGASHSLFRNWLFINESYFRPTSRRDRLSVPWDQWKEYCLIKDVSPSALISDPCVIGSRVLYVESDSGRNPSRGGHPSGCASRLTIIDFAPYPDASCHSNSVWPFVGKRSLLVPNENTRSVPSKTVDRLSIDDIRVTEDNIVLFLENRGNARPVNILTFGVPVQTRSRHEMHSPQL